MASIEDVARLAALLPEVTDGEDKFGHRSWAVAGKGFGWIRPFSKADVKRFGSETPPDGPILALRAADPHEKEAILARGVPGFFTIAHFNGYNAYLIQLSAVAEPALREALEDAWLSQAPAAIAEQYLGEGGRGRLARAGEGRTRRRAVTSNRREGARITPPGRLSRGRVPGGPHRGRRARAGR